MQSQDEELHSRRCGKRAGAKRSLGLIWAIAALLFTSCSEPVGCDPCFTSAVVYGTVATSAGEPVPGIPLEFRVYSGTCDTSFFEGWTMRRVPRTDTQGRFTGEVQSLSAPFVARCVEVRTNPDSLQGFPTRRFTFDASLELRADHTGERRDSAQLDIVLP